MAPAGARSGRKGVLAAFYHVVRRELHFISHSPFCTLFVFILPVASFIILWTVFYYEVPRDMPIVVRDGDHSALSRQLVRMAEASGALAVAGTVDDPAEGAAYIRRGEAYAMLYIPADFERDLKRRDAPAAVVYYNNQWLLTSGLISRAVREVVGTLSAGADVRARMLQGAHISQAMERYDPVYIDKHALFNPNMNYRYFLLPALLPTMMQMFIIMMTVRTVGGELKHGTARHWLDAAGRRASVALFGKLFPYTLAFIVMTNFMLALLVRFASVPFYGDGPTLVLGSVLFVLAYQSMGFAFAVLAANLRLANSLAGFYAGPAFAFAGITFPLAGMPLAAKCWSYSLPLTHYLNVMLQQALRGAPPEASFPSLAALCAFVLLPPALLLGRLNRVALDARYWGRL